MNTQQPVALIIGMGPGLSAALAERFAAGGHAVAGFARDPGKSAALAAQLAQRGQVLALRAVDAGDFAALGAAIAAVEAELGPIEVLIYNAYRATYAPPSEVPPAALMADAAVNIGGALAAVQAVLPAMRARGGGTILLTGGALALDPTGWLPAASLAVGKAGLRNLAYSLNAELAGSGIRVSTVTIQGMIAPGTGLAPERIAEEYGRLAKTEGPLPAERVFAGGTD